MTCILSFIGLLLTLGLVYGAYTAGVEDGKEMERKRDLDEDINMDLIIFMEHDHGE